MRIRRKLKEEEKEKKIELKVEIKDFGPISGGSITLKPLTLLIGPNNSGKSYAAMLVHSIFESYTPVAFPGRLPYFLRGRFFVEHPDTHAFLKEFPELKRQIVGLKEGEELEIPKQIIEKITNKIFEEIYEIRLSDEIVRSYACSLNELIRIEEKSFELKINVNSHSIHLAYQKDKSKIQKDKLKIQKDKLKIKEYPQLDIKVKVKVIKSHHPIGVEETENEIFINLDRLRVEREEKRFIDFQLMGLMDIISDKLVYRILNLAIPYYYLPAARSGILHGHKALAASIVKKAPYAGIERLEIPKFSGVVSDFISSVITLPEERGPFYQLAQDFEKELIKGEIVVRTLDEHRYPEIKYSFQKTEIPLHRASSTVSELAPLFLYLKYSIKPRSILIIEEPEAHLHPQNQRILAKFLVKLIRKDVNIVITTHSEYLLEQLSNFILLSKVEKKRVKRYNYSEDDLLNSDEISAYVFAYDKRSAGHKISEVEITEEDGISQEEFIKIHEALYEETIKLRRDLSADI